MAPSITVHIEPERLSAPAGSDVEGQVIVSNPTEMSVHLRVVVSGEVAGWATVEPSELRLQPGEAVVCQLWFRLPRGAPGGVGEVPFRVRVLSDDEGAGGATVEGSLAVVGQSDVALRLVPGTGKGTLRASVKVAADNLGSVPARAQLFADASPEVGIDVEPDTFIIEPGETSWGRVTIRPRSRFSFGKPRVHAFWVRLDPMGGARVSVEGQMLQRSLFAGFAPAVIFGVVALAVLAVVIGNVAGKRTSDLNTAPPVLTTRPTVPTTTTTAVATPTTAAPVAVGLKTTTTTIPLSQRRILFQSKRDGNYEVYSTKPDGTGPMNLTNNPANDGEPVWSPDRTRIAFDSDRSGNYDVWVMNADGSNPVQLTTEPTPDGYPTWSPDGTRMAFISLRDGNSEIYVMNADGSGQTRLTKNLSDDAHPAWSPDGKHIAFHTNRDGNYQIYVIGVDGSNPTNISNNSANDQEPAWSPNSNRIAFDSTRDGGKPELYLMGADGTLPVRLTTNDAVDKWPAWSPDGTKIAYQTDLANDLELYMIGAGGGQPKRITDSPAEDTEPNW